MTNKPKFKSRNLKKIKIKPHRLPKVITPNKPKKTLKNLQQNG